MQLVPLFPLPNVVLFPNVPLPLHVFEPRYRSLVADALASHRTVGMTLLRPGYHADYHGRPPIYALGCAGTIVEEELLEDGRYNIVLQGRERFRVVEEQGGAPYRLAVVERLEELACDIEALRQTRERLEGVLRRLADGESPAHPDLPVAAFVNGLCQGLDLPPVEKLDLLACESVEARARRLAELLEFHELERTCGRKGGGMH